MALPLSSFLAAWGFLALNIATPGPNVLNTIAAAMGSGRRAGLASAAAVGLGVGLWCLAMALGASAVFAVLPAAQWLLTLLATGLLATFALRYLRAAWRGLRDGARSPGGGAGLDEAASFRRSLLVNLLNPKALTSWLAILGLFPVARAGAGDIALLGAGASALAVAVHAGYALAFSTPRAARLYLQAGWAISGTAGLLFALFALRLGLGLWQGT